MDHLLPLHTESCTPAQLVIFDALHFIHSSDTTPCDLIYRNTIDHCVFFSSTQDNTIAAINSTTHNNTVPVVTVPSNMDPPDQYQAIRYAALPSSSDEASLHMPIMNPPLYAADEGSQDFPTVLPMSPYRDIDNLSPSIPALHPNNWSVSGSPHVSKPHCHPPR